MWLTSVFVIIMMQQPMRSKGQTVPVEMGNLPTAPPPWYNRTKFQRGQEFARRHFAGISLAHFVSLITMLTSPQILKVHNYNKQHLK